ncbi:unnamed protein product [Rotaria socialis]|uniref:Pheromone-processing carboxypeptidase KEX1 n=1 Tax=Rotaria socialis TaxID=392032 RepID=A0A820MAK7_9BILA|nr:unnamed protein product [Rotaria socialis]CAF3252502.1 unnamed protein product [Rotaria socialis]CAF4370879.1 unnamed protein product [Rotaria socialis]CAF4450556.1 unnamed protein product [Rotaria socialis]
MQMVIALVLIGISMFNLTVTSLQADDFYVHGLPLLPTKASSIRMHAGQIPISPKYDAALFFWHFASKNLADRSKTVIWLNGGPGCSSLIGAWLGIGPFRFQGKDTIIENDGSWHMSANLLFVDQPVGTGFSYTVNNSFISDLDEMANQFLSFLDRYVDVFPELLDDDIYLAGESFAGQYIPYIAKDILIKRSMLKLRGLLIGNGWIDPVTHYESYLPFAVAKNLVKVNSTFYNNIANDSEKCQQALSNKVLVLEETCSSILYGIVECSMLTQSAMNKKYRCVNVYDVRLYDTWPACGRNWPPEMEYITLYLHRKDVRSRIHVDRNTSEWEMCVDSVTRTLAKTESEPSIKFLPDLLQQVPLLLYSSEYDLICNHWGMEKMMDNITWNNRTGFDLGNGTLAPLDPWFADDDEPVGLIRTARNLSYILFYKAGHVVAYDYPRRSLAMLNQFMQLKLYSNAYQARKRNTFRKMITSIRGAYKSIYFIAFVSFLIIITLTGMACFVIRKQRHIRMRVAFIKPRVLESQNLDVSLQQMVVYSPVGEAQENM